ncbi:maltose excess protein 1-like, chloroplastic isoform X1 [Phoenix dactylifera]|uniref:Maltose excess protein 1-like, chloroplastic isoform X1 n=1 Tax=Phoenix dactylifera TaxID=42345 RepID=A0A8B7CY21_PHODC|nr:maltose excess protein 1-like, chloroplastic isoform X1 [Phoenix dactylifera]
MTPYAVAPLASLPTASLRCLFFASSLRLPHLRSPRSHSNRTPTPSFSTAPRRCPPSAASAVDSPAPFPSNQASRFQQWDSMTAKFAGASNVPFLLIQLPQILLNSRNLVAGNKAALFALPWLGMLTGLLGNLTLLSYFAKKKETEAIVVQTLGVVSIYVVIAQLATAGAVPLPHFTALSAVVASGLVLNFMNYFNWIGEGVWLLWEDFITITGLSVLPQVMWSTFVPFVPNSILPGTISCIMAVAAVIMARTGKLSEKGVKFIRSVSGWTATLLFMWMPIAQMWTSYLNPDNIKGLSAFTLLLGMIGNGLMVPRALFIRDLMWFTGASWASFLHGWGNLAWMYCFNSISREFFLAATLGLFIWIGIALWRDTIAYGYSSPLKSLKELVFG